MHLFPLIHDLAVILGVAGVVGVIFRRLKQPVVLGYLLAGLIVGPHTPPFAFVKDLPNVQVWAELGVIFLMFALGLEFSFRRLSRVGSSAGITAGFEVVFMLVAGFSCGQALGWSRIDSVLLGAMLSVSSTTIIVKSLADLNLKTHRFAELVFGVLIVEDLVAILMLVALSTFAQGTELSAAVIIGALGKLVLVTGTWFLVGYFILPRLIRYTGKIGSNETLTILSLGLCLGLVVLASHYNYSVALGAFIMGSILAESSESHRIEELMGPLKDVFGAIFFVSVGMLLNPTDLWKLGPTILLITTVTIGAKIVSTALGALTAGQSLKSSVQAGFSLAQIGEFSFIIAALGQSSGLMSEFLYPVIVAVSVVTTFTTPFLIGASEKAALALEARLPVTLKQSLLSYAWRSHEGAASSQQREAMSKAARKWFLNGILVSAVFVFGSDLSTQLTQSMMSNDDWAFTISWLMCILASAPFLWAMWSAVRGLKVLFWRVMFRSGSLIWLAILSMEYFSARLTILLMSFLLACFFILFYRRLEASYRWFERHFLSTFNEPLKAAAGGTNLPSYLAPWDAHLVRWSVHSNAELVQKTFMQARLRERFGLNAIALHRGARTILPPDRNEVILPGDELLLLGTDEQMEKARPIFEKPTDLPDDAEPLAGYDLIHCQLGEGTFLENISIRASRIREEHGALVVGVDRDGQRILNPESDLVLRSHDILWVVGRSESLQDLRKRLKSP